MQKSALETLKHDLQAKVTDPFENGAVIRWISGGRYTYAAIKTPVGWFTTASSTNRYVEKTLDYEELVEVLSSGDVTDIMAASEWTPLQ